MKKFLFLTGFTYLFVLSSQDTIAQNINTNPFWEGEIEMTDGSSKSGLVQVPNIAAEKNIAFKSSKNSRTENFNRQDISSISVVSKNGNSYYFDNLPFNMTKKERVSKKKMLLLKQAQNNYVTFYIVATYKANNRRGEIDLISRYAQGKDLPMFSYFMSKRDQPYAQLYYMTNQLGGIKKNAELHFKEDPELVKKIKSKELKKNDIREIITTFLRTTENM